MSTGKLLFASTFVFALLSSATLQAATYTWVYALDTRPPAEVFKNGFSIDGTLLDLLEHAVGGACTAETSLERSAWVSTTFSFNRALEFAEQRIAALPATPSGQRHMWLYHIHTDASFLEVADILRQARARAPGDVQTSNAIDHLLQRTRIASQAEVVAPNRIPVANIQGVTSLYYDPALAVGERFYRTNVLTVNSQYRVPATTMNNVVSNLTALVPPESIALFGHQLAPDQQLCELACAAHHANRLRRSAAPGDLNCLASPDRAQAFIGSED